MNRSTAANIARQARSSAAARARAAKAAASVGTCPHDHVELVDCGGVELEHCTDCDTYGPWSK